MPFTKQDQVLYRISKSKETLDDAKLLAQNQRWDSCINRIYYSAFYLVSALLLKHDIKTKTHKGTMANFYKEFVHANKMNKERSQIYGQLFDWRGQSDYLDFTNFEESEVKPLIEQVEKFNREVLDLIEATKD